MTALKELQQQFQSFLLAGDSSIISELAPLPNQSVKNRLDIYRNGYFVRLHNNLADDFPGLKAELGEQKFKELISAYLQNYPSNHYSITHIGEKLAAFIQEKYAEPFWTELALFEYEMIVASLAENKPWLDLAWLANIPPEQQMQLKFRWHPSVKKQSFYFNTPEYWQALLTKRRVTLRTRKNLATYLIWNYQHEIYFMSLSKSEMHFATAITQQLNFVEVCEAIADSMPEEKLIPWVAKTVRNWVQQGILIL